MKQRYNIMAFPRDMEILNKVAYDLCLSRSEIICNLIRDYCIEHNLYTRYLSDNKIQGQIELDGAGESYK